MLPLSPTLPLLLHSGAHKDTYQCTRVCVCARMCAAERLSCWVCVYKLLGDTVKESLLGALMSLTLFPTNKRQSWARERARAGDWAWAWASQVARASQPKPASQPARHLPWHRTGISITISPDAATSLSSTSPSPSRSLSSSSCLSDFSFNEFCRNSPRFLH